MELPTESNHRWVVSTGRNRDMSSQTPAGSFRPGIEASPADSILLLGHDLATELLGHISFGELAYWLLANRRPTQGQRAMVEAVVVGLPAHAVVPAALG